MPRYALEVMYDGTRFHGSQVQGGLPTVQLALNTMLSTALRMELTTFGASRTDEGVHALCNFYHFDLPQEPDADLRYKGNAILPKGVSIRQVYRVADDFNSRFDAVSRRYRYRIYHLKNPFLQQRALFFPFRLNDGLLHETAAIIKEYEHFESFSKRNSQSKTFVCRIMRSYWERTGDELHYIVEANRFLRGMVRGLVGTQLHISRRNGTTGDFRKIAESRDCTNARFDVAGHGLYLENIRYPEGALTPLYP